MKRIFSGKMLGLIVAMVALVALVAMATSATGAYFSDSKAGAIAGTSGTIAVAAGANADMGGGLNFSWPSMLPGQVYSATAYYSNTGDSVQDVWLVFPNKTALSALASLGAYGAVQVLDSSSGSVFYSNNLNDHPVDQGGTTPPRGTVKMVPQMILLRSNLPVGANGAMTFKFQYATKFGNSSMGLAFNPYPLSTPGSPQDPNYATDGNLAGYAQRYVVSTDGVGTGLPFQIVATQPGIAPDAAGAFAGF
jgi:hypothetical protein